MDDKLVHFRDIQTCELGLNTSLAFTHLKGFAC